MSAKSVLLEPQHLLDPDLEHTLIVVKPDGYARGLTGEILRRIEAKGYTIKGLSSWSPPASCSPSTTPTIRTSPSSRDSWSS